MILFKKYCVLLIEKLNLYLYAAYQTGTVIDTKFCAVSISLLYHNLFEVLDCGE